MRIIRKAPFILFILILCSSLMVQGCKDTEATHVAGLLETCKLLLNERSWEDAIETCGELESDEGKHLTAIAYMGRSGLTLSNLLVELTDSSATPTSLIFGQIPDTDAKAADYKKALQLIMGEITTKSTTMYLEGILLSSLLIFKELKTLLGLSVADGQIQTCAGDPADLNNCSFAPTVDDVVHPTYGDVPGLLVFNGLGTSFYQGICGDITTDAASVDSSTDTTTTINISTTVEVHGTVSVDVTYDVTIHGSPIGRASALYYNKVASEAYAVSGTEDLSSLNFYGKMDTGTNFEIVVDPLPSISFCNSGAIEPPDASDDRLNDCEVLSFLKNPGI